MCVLFGLAAVSPPAEAQVTKIVPISSSFYHWDHHWYIWLPGDPLYEAVEVMSTERGASASPLVWVFFTERSGSKLQVHYFNDAQVAAARRALFREFSFTITGAEGRPRGVNVALNDADGHPVAIEVSFSPEAQLVSRGAGLTDQSGHAVDQHLLFFFRELNAIAETRSVVRAGLDRVHPTSEDNHLVPWPAAYSSNIFVASLPYAERRATFDSDAASDPGVINFSSTAAEGASVARLPDGSQIELIVAKGDGLQAYRHRQGSHALEISFATPLHIPHYPTTVQTSAFQVAFDGFREIATGIVSVAHREKSIVLDWRLEKPDWARPTQLRTICDFAFESGERIAVRRLAGG
jgi:hypothetical protein